MGIEQFVLERERKIGEQEGLQKGMEKGMEEKAFQFARTMITQTDFDDAKIATLTGVDISVIRTIRAEMAN